MAGLPHSLMAQVSSYKGWPAGLLISCVVGAHPTITQHGLCYVLLVKAVSRLLGHRETRDPWILVEEKVSGFGVVFLNCLVGESQKDESSHLRQGEKREHECGMCFSKQVGSKLQDPLEPAL